LRLGIVTIGSVDQIVGKRISELIECVDLQLLKTKR
jgi:hypothetical protein